MTAIDIQPERPTLSLPPVAPLVLAVVGVALVCVMAFPFGQWRYVIAVCIGTLAGIGLYHAAFGFTAAW